MRFPRIPCSRISRRAAALAVLALGMTSPLTAQQAPGTADATDKISSTAGGFTGPLADGDRFGEGVASLGDLDGDLIADLVVTAYWDDTGGTNCGAAWVLLLNSDRTVKASVKIGNGLNGFPSGAIAANSWFGRSVANIGDLDGDGITDIAVGANRDSDGGGDTGAVWILFLNSDGTVASTQKISALSGGFGAGLSPGDFFGVSLSALGDLDGDLVPDLAVGAGRADDGGADKGAAWILFLNADGTVKAKQKIAEGVGGFTGPLSPGDEFGNCVSAIGDVDGDGTIDLAVGAPREDDGGSDKGTLWMLSLDTDGTVLSQLAIREGEAGFSEVIDPFDFFGWSVTGLGDLDGDGVPDVAVGAVGDDDGATDAGAVYVLFLNTDFTVKRSQKLSNTAGLLGSILASGDSFGRSMTDVGDFDGDGIMDIAVGAYRDDDGGSDRGAVWVAYLHAGVIADLGNSLAGTSGAPQLTVTGSMWAPDPISLVLSNAMPASSYFLIIGYAAINAPFKGGVLVPNPDLVFSLPTAATTIGPFAWPVGVPSGFPLYIQEWVLDAGGPFGMAATNAVGLTTP